jgi:adenylate cyclase
LACRSALAMKAAEQELNTKITAEQLSPSPFFTRIGINTGVMVVGNMGSKNKYELLAAVQNAGPGQIKLAEIFDEALDCFERRNWKQAAEGFREALLTKAGDGPAEKYLDRCLEFLANPPPDTWDGVYNLTEK